MKKILKLLVVLTLTLTLCACSTNEKQLNYILTKENEINVYEIEGKKYVESKEPTNLVKIDVDNYGIIIAELYPEIAPITVENFKKLMKDIDCPIDLYNGVETLVQQTPSGGLHIIYKSDDELSQVNGTANAFKDYPGIDLRNRNYIVSEPSVINGNSYRFLTNYSPKEMPIELKNFILENTPLKNDSKKEPYKKPTSVECGDRDNQLFSYINSIYYKTSLDFDEILCLALHFNENVLEEPFPEKTVKYKVKKVFEKTRDKYLFIKLYDE